MPQTALVHPLPLPAAQPVRFRGRAVLRWHAVHAAALTTRALHRACDPSRLEADRLAAYCEQTGRESWTFERAVLREAIAVVDHATLVRRLAATICSATGHDSLGVRLSARGDIDGFRLRLHVRSASSIGRRLDVDLAADPDRVAAASPVTGDLHLEGVLVLGERTLPIVGSWPVDGAEPLTLEPGGSARQVVTAAAAAVALDRIGEAIGWRLRSQLDAACEPPLGHRVTAWPGQSRAYQTYWRRLRDYLVWCASHDV